MRLFSGKRWRALWLVLMAAVAPGCADMFGYDSPSWWNAKAKKEKAAALAEYGPSADQRVETLRELAKQAPKMSPEQQQQQATELAQQLRSETDPLVRMHIMRTLGEMHGSAVMATLQAGLKDKEPDVRVVSCRSLAKQNTPEAAQMLGGALASDTNIDVRLAAVRALGGSQDPESARRALAVALEDPDPAMQYRAVAALKSMSGQNLGNDVEAWRQYARGESSQQKPEATASRGNGNF